MRQPNRKFEEVYDVSDYEVMTPDGWKDINKICKTIPYEVWEIKLENGMYLKGADTHIIFSNNQEVFIKDVKIGQYIDTKNGPSKCIEVKNLLLKENMYDMQVEGEKYYSNGIFSHNTTTVGVFALWYAIFNSDKVIGIVSNKEASAKMILARMKRMYEDLPVYLKPGVVSYAKTMIEFDNGTKVMISATSPDAFRGETINLLFSDELAFVPKNQADDFWASNFPTISASDEARLIVISTPQGMFNLFHRIYSGAERGINSFKYLRVSWRRVPGRDEKWKEEQIKNMGIMKFNQEHECRFLGSTNTVIDFNTLEVLINSYIDPKFIELNDKLSIYEKPVDGCVYSLGCDTAKGTGEHYSSIQILKLISMKPIKMEQVAVFFDNNTDVYQFADIINRLSNWYTNSYIMVENNSEGAAVVNRLWWEHENEKLVNTGSKAVNLGIRATTKTKPRAVLLMKKLIEDGSLKIHDKETVNELASFVEDNNKFYGKNTADDAISALYWACYLLEMNLLDENFEFRKKTEEEEESWGIIPDNEGIGDDWSWL